MPEDVPDMRYDIAGKGVYDAVCPFVSHLEGSASRHGHVYGPCVEGAAPAVARCHEAMV